MAFASVSTAPARVTKKKVIIMQARHTPVLEIVYPFAFIAMGIVIGIVIGSLV
jgi:hypothetical protein